MQGDESMRREPLRLSHEPFIEQFGPLLAKARQLAPPFYREWAELLDVGLVAEAKRLPAHGLVPLHLRAAAELADPREEGAEAFLTSLLAPVRSGLVLMRADLVRAARELGLGLRLGERRFALRALLAQEALGTLRWLAGEAEISIDLHRRAPRGLAPVTDFWAARAERTAALLTDLALESEREVVGV